jgi:hypothetical protein
MLSQVTPRLRAQVFRVRPGVDAADRDHETHPVDRGDQAPAEQLRERNLGLGVDEHGVGGAVAVRAQVVLVDVGEPVAGQRVRAGDHRSEADVERVRGQQGRDRDVQVGQPRRATGDRAERRREVRVQRHQLQDQLRQVDLWQHRRGPLAQVDQAGRLVEGVVSGQV